MLGYVVDPWRVDDTYSSAGIPGLGRFRRGVESRRVDDTYSSAGTRGLGWAWHGAGSKRVEDTYPSAGTRGLGWARHGAGSRRVDDTYSPVATRGLGRMRGSTTIHGIRSSIGNHVISSIGNRLSVTLQSTFRNGKLIAYRRSTPVIQLRGNPIAYIGDRILSSRQHTGNDRLYRQSCSRQSS